MSTIDDMPARPSRLLIGLAALAAVICAGTATLDASPPPDEPDPTDAPLPPGPDAPLPPGPDDPPGTDFLRAQAESEFALEHPGVTEVACVEPAADTPGVRFTCYGTMPDGSIAVAEGSMNDIGGIEFAPADSPIGTIDAPEPAAYAGEGNELVQVPRITLLTIVEATHDGDGEFRVQPQDAGAPIGAPIVETSGASAGRYLVGADGAVSALAVVADGEWSLRLAPATEALVLDPAAPLDADQPDVVSYADTSELGVTLDYPADGTIVVTAYTAAGRTQLLGEAGPLAEVLTLPPGPGYVTIDAVGSWSLTLGGEAPDTTGVG